MSNDQRFDWPPSLQAPFIEALVNTMFPKADPPKSGQNVAETHRNRLVLATQVISALYQAYSSPHAPNTVSYPKKADRYELGHHEKLDYSKRRAIDVFKRLEELDWIAVTPAVTGQKYTRIEAKGYLAEVFDEVGLVWFPQRPLLKHRTVLLRDVKRNKSGKPIRTGKNQKTIKEWKPVVQTDDVLRMQENLYEINSFLSKQCITLDLNDEQLKQVALEVRRKQQDEVAQDYEDDTESFVDYVEDVEADSLVDLRRVQLVRIFARGSMEKGGRFYRGWWQGIPSRYRPHLRINGKKTVEIDYSTMHLSILYANVDLKPTIGHDAYDLGLPNWADKDDPRRKHIKVAVNALLNDEDGIYKLNKQTEAAIGLTNDQFHEALKTKHPELYDRMTSDIGLKLQKIDSDIAETVLLWFTRLGIPCLPIHDSFIVTVADAWNLEAKLKEIFKTIVGNDIDVDIDVVKNREHFSISANKLDDKNIPEADRVISGKDTYEMIFGTKCPSLMDEYLMSFERFIAHTVYKNKTKQ